ncbi:MAG: hypothetical protein AB7G06_09970 [Bdellovibrionales bacterium]
MTLSFQLLDQALRDEDIEGFIALGAPADEYTSEAHEIASIVNGTSESQMSEAAILEAFVSVWARSFNLGPEEMEMRLPAIRKVVQQVTTR